MPFCLILKNEPQILIQEARGSAKLITDLERSNWNIYYGYKNNNLKWKILVPPGWYECPSIKTGWKHIENTSEEENHIL